MTKSNGRVGVSVKVPVLGTVSDTRTIEDIVDGQKPADPYEGQPAVTYTVLDRPVGPPPDTTSGAQVAARTDPAPPSGASDPQPPQGGTPTVTADGPKPAASEADEDEKKARTLLSLAENYIRCGMRAKAIEKLKIILDQYPNTEAAKKAAEVLKPYQ